MVGGLLPILVTPLLIAFLPKLRCATSGSRTDPAARRATPFELFRHDWRSARSSYGWSICSIWWETSSSCFGYRRILHAKGLSPSQAILATTMYALGSIIGALVTAPIVDRFGVERVIAFILCMGAFCVLLIGTLDLPFPLLCVVICAAGTGIGGCQHGINCVSGALYPAPIRSTGTGWALALGRVGQIGGPLIGGILLGLGWTSRDIFLVASVPAFCVAIGMAMLGRLRKIDETRAPTATGRSARDATGRHAGPSGRRRAGRPIAGDGSRLARHRSRRGRAAPLW